LRVRNIPDSSFEEFVRLEKEVNTIKINIGEFDELLAVHVGKKRE